MGQKSQYFKEKHSQSKPDSPYPKGARRTTFRIPAEVPTDRWFHVKTNKGKDNWRSNERNARHAMVYRRQFNNKRKEELRLENYKGKNPMSRSQSRRQQRVRKAERETLAAEEVVSTSNKEMSSTNKPTTSKQPENKPPVSRRLFADTKPDESKEYTPGPEEDEDMLTDNFESEGESSLNLNCNVVSVLPAEFGQETEIEEQEEDDTIDMMKHRPVCYYVMDNGAVEEQNPFFEHPEPAMKNHFKPLFIRAKAGAHGVNKVLVDGGAAVNLMPQFMLKKLGIQESDVKPHNMVLSNYEGKVGQTLGVVQVELTVGSSYRPTMFMVIEAKANYNLLLGR